VFQYCSDLTGRKSHVRLPYSYVRLRPTNHPSRTAKFFSSSGCHRCDLVLGPQKNGSKSQCSYGISTAESRAATPPSAALPANPRPRFLYLDVFPPTRKKYCTVMSGPRLISETGSLTVVHRRHARRDVCAGLEFPVISRVETPDPYAGH
jgi:hypothetical protein